MSASPIVGILNKEKIPIFLPGDLEYERSVATANLLYRFSRPGFVVQPESIPHVQYIVVQAKERGIPITIKNGGHSYAGFSSTDKGILLDLSKLNQVELDLDSGIAKLSGGAKWGHAYRALLNGKLDGYVINGGRCPFVGVSGFTLGGGLGPFTRSFGMGVDTLKEVTMVAADGSLVTVNEDDAPNTPNGELFWALRGGGGGNFGVVVTLKTSIEKLKSSEGLVVSGRYTWFPGSDDKSLSDLMATMKKFYVINWPNELTIDTSWLCNLQQSKSLLGIRFLVYYNGNKADFDKLIDRYLPRSELGKQLKRRSMQEKSTRFFHETLVSQWSEETVKAFPENPSYTIFSSFVFKKDTGKLTSIISIIRDEMQSFREKFSEETGLLQVTFIHSGGKASEKQRSDTAFRWRDGTYHAYIMIDWAEKWLGQDMGDFCTDFKRKLRPFSMCQRAAFINFADRQLQESLWEKAYYGNNYSKLQRVKQTWDPDNYFAFNQSIRPPSSKKKSSRKKKAASQTAMFMAASIGDDSGSEEASVEGYGTEDEGPVMDDVDDEAWVDGVARDQWETFIPPPPTAELLRLPGYPYYRGF